MPIRLNRQAGVPLAQQIYQELSDRIRSGLLPPGAPLPSIRQLSLTCGVSFMTVVRAYNLLEQAGLVTRTQGKGTYVRSSQQEMPPDGVTEHACRFDWQLMLTDYLPRAQNWKKLIAQGEASISFSCASLYPGLAPHADLTACMRAAVQDDPAAVIPYGPVQGDLSLREAMTKSVKPLGLSLVPEETIVTNGAQQAIDLVARSFVGPGDVVVTEAPTYAAAIDVFRSRGAVIVPVPVDGEGMRVDLLASLCDRRPPKLIYTIPTFQNPTGTVMSRRRRVDLVDLAQSYHSLILEDDPWSEIWFETPPPPPVKSLDEHGHVIYVKSFSKIVAPGVRLALLAASGTILNRLTAAKATADLGSPLLTQHGLRRFLTTPAAKKHLANLRTRMLHRRNRVLRLLKQHAPPGITWTVPSGGYNVWLTLPPWIHTDELIIPASREGIDFLPGSVCYPGEPETNHLRISFSAMSEEQLTEGIVAFCRVLDRAVSSRRIAEKPPLV